MRVLVFGASITQGFWDTEGGWVARLRRHYDELEVKNFKDNQPTIFNLGISGDTTRGVIKRLDSETAARVWPGEDFIFIFCIGTNNALIKSDGQNLAEPAEYKADMIKITQSARQFSSKILLAELPPCDEKLTQPVAWADVSYTNERIALFNKAMNEVASEQEVPIVGMFEELKKKFEGGADIFADGLHPNNDGHQLIFELVRPELDKLLNT